jgi:aspartate-semialdehyde dehydrogenase
MAADRNQKIIVIAGASSLLGSELKSLLEESRFASWELQLVDEDVAAGTLTEAGGEPAVIQKVDEDTFRGARFAFLTGSRAFSNRCLAPAKEAGAAVADLSGATLSDPDAIPWFPKIQALTGKTIAKNSRVFAVFSAGGMAIASLALALKKFGLQRLVAAVYWPVSEAGREGIEELETQTSQLLSFQPIGHRIFGTQTAFNLLPSYGEESRQLLRDRLLSTRAEITAAIGDPDDDAKLSLNILHVPVFYGTTFSACVDLNEEVSVETLSEACKEAGFSVTPAVGPGPSNVSVAGETSLYLREPSPDSNHPKTWWFWGAADNLRVPAYSSVKLAEWLDS